MDPKITVIIPVYNGHKTITQCLNSVISAKPKNKKIIVVNNNSKDNTKEIVKEYKQVKILDETTKGPAAARNKGLQYVTTDVVIFIDSDVIVRENSFLELLKHLKGNKIAGVGGVPESYEKTSVIALSQEPRFLGNSIYDKKIKAVDHIPTAIGAYKTDILRQMDGFDEAYFPSGEDVDLNYRIRKKKYKLLMNPNVRVYHDHVFTLKNIIQKWYYYGVGWSKVAKEHKKYKDTILTFGWFASLIASTVLAIMYPSLVSLPLLVFVAPWFVYYSIPTFKYYSENLDPKVVLFPIIQQIQIIARSIGIVKSTLRQLFLGKYKA